ncbi:MAG: spore coat protein [Candidatus Taylorbacteria bacterium]|nr:spore coat protein [Candidatus Taylorbacteria bacterium]
MKGIILAGGGGTRLRPLTVSTNKHLLALYDKPVIYYAVKKLVDAGIDRIMIVTSPEAIESMVKLLGSGADFMSKRTGKQIQIVYGIQNQPNGIAYGLWIAKDYIGNDNCVLYLGDNIFEDDLTPHIKKFKSGATVFLKEVADPERFGIATLGQNSKILDIDEKPTKPKTNYAVTGVYMYDSTVFKKCLSLKASERGEYEITDINKQYIKDGKLHGIFLKKEWFDIGTFDSLLETANFIRNKNNDNKKK